MSTTGSNDIPSGIRFLQNHWLLALVTGLYPFLFFLQHNGPYVVTFPSFFVTLIAFVLPPLLLTALISRFSTWSDERQFGQWLLAASVFWLVLFLNIPIRVLLAHIIPDKVSPYTGVAAPLEYLFTQVPQVGMLLVLLTGVIGVLTIFRGRHYLLTTMLLIMALTAGV